MEFYRKCHQNFTEMLPKIHQNSFKVNNKVNNKVIKNFTKKLPNASQLNFTKKSPKVSFNFTKDMTKHFTKKF